jgi:hypothetical protein
MMAAGAVQIATPGPLRFRPEPTGQAASATSLKIVFAD